MAVIPGIQWLLQWAGKSRIGYVNNPSLAPIIVDVTAKDKEIYAIQFVNDKLGYVSGSGLSTYLQHPAVAAATGLPNGTTTYKRITPFKFAMEI